MKTKNKIFLAAASCFLLLAAKPAAAQCEPFPRVSLWGDYTHARVKKYVAVKLDGDWSSYVTRLQSRLDSLKAIQARGGTLKLKYRGKRVALRGSKLDSYVVAAERRVAVAQCLANEADPENLDNFATAAGGQPVVSTATVDADGLRLRVRGECAAGVATFKVTNLGKGWPKAGLVGVYRIGSDQPQRISKRRIRFAEGQTSTFRVKNLKGAAGDLALWVNPSWANRDFAYDATLSCS